MSDDPSRPTSAVGPSRRFYLVSALLIVAGLAVVGSGIAAAMRPSAR